MPQPITPDRPRPVLRGRFERPSWEETAHAAFRAGDPAELERLQEAARDTIRRQGREAEFARVHEYIAQVMGGSVKKDEAA